MSVELREYRKSEPRDVNDIIADVIFGMLQKGNTKDDTEQRHDYGDDES